MTKSSSYISTFILKILDPYEEQNVKANLLQGVNDLTTGAKRAFREWRRLEVNIHRKINQSLIFIPERKYLAEQKPHYYYFSFNRTLQILPKDFKRYFKDFEVVASSVYSLNLSLEGQCE